MVDLPDPSNFFDLPLNGAAITDTQGYNYSFYNNPEVNRLIVQADLAFAPVERRRLLQRMEAIVMEDSPWAPIAHEGRVFLRSRRLHGLKAHPV
jgi:peptide/nickel transport system substrate-binding protein